MTAFLRTGEQFEELVERLLLANGFTINGRPNTGQDFGYDFLADKEGQLWAIQVKHYRTERAQISLLSSAAAQVAVISRSRHAKPMLVVSSSLPAGLGASLETSTGVRIVDRSVLFAWAALEPTLADELAGLLEMTANSVPRVLDSKDHLGSRPVATSLGVDTQGDDLCQELRALPRGKDTWTAYEGLCKRVLKYLFGNDLKGWHSQTGTRDGQNRYDQVCRITPTTEFWRFCIDNLNSRFVLFEFKNYTERIKQGQILTTEKYLLEKGLRRVAIVMCRVGAHTSATLATQGAMRDSGKLILTLNDDVVCKMLRMKQAGDDPSDLLFETADDFLLSLPR